MDIGEVSLADAIKAVRAELDEAIEDARRPGDQVGFRYREVEIELDIALTKEGSTNGGAKVRVVSAEAGGNSKPGATHRITIVLDPDSPQTVQAPTISSVRTYRDGPQPDRPAPVDVGEPGAVRAVRSAWTRLLETQNRLDTNGADVNSRKRRDDALVLFYHVLAKEFPRSAADNPAFAREAENAISSSNVPNEVKDSLAGTAIVVGLAVLASAAGGVGGAILVNETMWKEAVKGAVAGLITSATTSLAERFTGHGGHAAPPRPPSPAGPSSAAAQPGPVGHAVSAEPPAGAWPSKPGRPGPAPSPAANPNHPKSPGHVPDIGPGHAPR